MGTEAVYQISLIAAYIAGMVALFAPCCISYLFPAYLGNIFKERKDVVFMTLIYSLGIFVTLMPIILGAKALQSLFFDLHDQTYLFGGVFMLVVAVLSFLGIKLPMPHIAMQGTPKHDITSTFTLGVFSGITSACCAPVLVGVIALSSLSPTVIQSLGVGASYVLGMVTPLYVASLFVHKKNILKNPLLKKVLGVVTIGSRQYPIFVSNIIATAIFGITGVLMLYLTSVGKLGMSVAESQVTKSINQVAFQISDLVSTIPGLDLIFAIIGIYLLTRFVKTALSMNQKDQTSTTNQYTCPMHPDVVSDHPGKCPKCGGMELIRMGSKPKMEHMHHHGSHADMMASPEAAADFLHRFFIVTVLLVPLFIFKFLDLPILQFIVASVIFYFGFVFFEHARHEIMAKQYGMMTLVSIAISAGYLFSAASTFLPSLNAEFYLEIATLIWVLLFGHYLEAKSSAAAGNALSEVAKLLPQTARMLHGTMEHEVNVAELKPGDIVRVLAGEKIPADGVILKGFSDFNEAHITGESKPVKKSKGDAVVAGAICIDGSVDVKLTRVGESSTIGQIKSLIAEASQTKPSAQRLADRAASMLTFSAVTVAIITIVVWLLLLNATLAFALTLTITVLVIACPHALGLAIPTVSTIATKLAVKNGLFIKDLAKLEVAKKADYVVFDKTGTLTKGEFSVSADKKVLQIAASLEAHSSHVIGKSIVSYAKSQKLKLKKVTAVKTIAGKGIEGKINGKKYFVGRFKVIPIAVLAGDKLLGEIVLADQIKPESKQAVADLHALGLKVAMLTGDSEEVAKSVAEKLEIDTYFAQILPEEKYKIIKYLQNPAKYRNSKLFKKLKLKIENSTNIVVFVGDGVNDAPALTQANVGIAVASGTDVAVEAGDVVLTSSNPEDVVAFIKLSRKVYRKMIQNLFWALGYNVLAIPAAAGLFIPLGFRLTPALGALLMSGSSAIVVANALTLRKAKL